MTANSKKILVIGGSGFVGMNLVPTLLKDGHTVTVLNRGNNPMKGSCQIIADREDAGQLDRAAKSSGDFDVVIDTSAYNQKHVATAWASFSEKTTQWIHLGSAAVYKETSGRHPTEKDTIGGAAIWAEYGVEKSEADEFLIRNAGKKLVAILRPPYLYGPGNNNDRETFVWARALQNRPVVVPGDGNTPIQFLHIEDLAAIIKALITKVPTGIVLYNVASDERPTLSEWVAMVAEVAGCKNPGILARDSAESYTPRQYFPFRDYPCCVDVVSAKTKLGWEAKYSLANGFRQTYATQDRDALLERSLDTGIEDQILNAIRKMGSNGLLTEN